MELKFAATDGSNSTGSDIQPRTSDRTFWAFNNFLGKTNDKNQHQLRPRQENIRFDLQNRLKLDGMYDRIAISRPKLVDPLCHCI